MWSKEKTKHQGRFYRKDATPSQFPAAGGKGQKLKQLSGNQPKTYLGNIMCYTGTIYLGKNGVSVLNRNHDFIFRLIYREEKLPQTL